MYPPATVSMWWTLGPICGFGPVLISKAEPLASADGRRSGQWRRPIILGTLANCASKGWLGLWRGETRRGRAGQAFEFGEPDVVDGTTANSLATDYHGPRQDDQVVKTKPRTRSCLRVLDQSLGPT